MAKMQYDVTFVGGGIAGLMGAAFATKAGLRVAVLEADEHCGTRATGSNAASFSLHFGSKEVCEMAEKSLPHFQKPFWSERSYVQFRGKIFLARKHQQQALQLFRDKPKSNGKYLEELGAPDAASLLSPLGLRAQDGDTFLFDPEHAFIDIASVVSDIVNYLRKNEALVLNDARVTKITRSGAGWSVAHSRYDFAVHSKAVVNTAGAWSDEVADLMGAENFNLVNLGRTAGWFHVAPDVQKRLENLPMIHEVENAFFARPFGNQWFVSPVDDLLFAELDDLQIQRNVMEAQQKLSTWFEHIPNKLSEVRVGFRSFQANRLPEVSVAKSQPNLFNFTALGGYGIKIAPECAQQLTSLLIKNTAS